ncbi:FACT complex subunit [Glutinoglossum americanum]|uniref:FACT complex subunit POB3 n=1 Tax=Glutinoglossum americanum TaxID=1670608 RepID=A0A9P8KY53_9PEZI|nr:FACT complex subunit [Glutinoglossum americanum]
MFGRVAQWESFENIYLDLSKQLGKCRFAETGLGWKPAGGGDTFTLDATSIASAQWSRASRGYELKVLSRTSGIHQLDGFLQEDFERLSKIFKHSYSVNLEHKEHALRGWNWGKGEFAKSELAFMVQNKPAFEIPYSEISNTNLAGKNEVAVEFSLPANSEDTGTNGHLGGARGRGKKAGAGRDQLVEMRFYIPGTAKKGTDPDGAGSSDEEGDEQEEQNAATLFYDTLMEKADIGEVAGDTFATFLDVLHLTPRGRYDIDMYENSFRLRGKTYDYKIQYDHIKKFMLLPKPDDLHTLITIGLEPPLRQGQTRYPFLVMQFKRDEEVEVDLNMTEELLKEKYSGKLQAHYESPLHAVVAQIFRGLTGKKVVTPSKDFVRYKKSTDISSSTIKSIIPSSEQSGEAYMGVMPGNSSHHQQSGVKCSIKANEGHLYCLDKSFMFVPKPATYIAFDNVSSITMSRVGGALAASRTFDITITLKGGGGEHQFSNINREEQQPLEEFFKRKGLRTKNEMVDDSSALIQAALADASDLASSADESPSKPNNNAGGMRGSADEDSESVDEDFHASSESDVAEEYDSAHESSGSEGEEEEMDVDVDDGEDAEEEERPRKKVKSGGK